MERSPARVPREMALTGELTGKGDLVIEGRVDGSLKISGAMTVEPGAEVGGEIEADRLRVAGRLAGQVQVKQAVTVERTGFVVGRLVTPLLVVVEGAQLHCRLEMNVELPDGVR